MNVRLLCHLLFVLLAVFFSETAPAHGGGMFHGGGGYGGGYRGGYGGGGYGGGYGGVNHGSSASGANHWSGGYYHGGYYHGGYYHGGYYHGGYYGCCGSVSVGFYFGPGFVYGYPFSPYYPYYYPPYYATMYYPYVSGDTPEPAQYIEQGQGQDQAVNAGTYIERGVVSQPGFWYYCNQSQAYYPYVRTCAGGWQPVPARPPHS